jgi:uncharacterized protein YraI
MSEQNIPTLNENAPNIPEKNNNQPVLMALIILASVALILGIGLVIGMLLNPSGETDPVYPTAPTVIVPTAQPSGPYAVAKTAVNVRSGPGTSYPIYGVAQPGQSAVVVGKSPDGMWWQIQISPSYSPDGLGWVSGEYVDAYNSGGVPIVQPAPLPPVIQPPIPVPGAPVVVTLDAVYVRTGPGTDYPAYGVAPKGTYLEVIGVNEDASWVQVKIPTAYSSSGTGWISADWVTEVPPQVNPL